MPQLEIRVEQHHIEKGIIKSSDQCPICRAIKEQHPREFLWLVYVNVIDRWPGSTIPLPQKAQEFIRSMLAKQPVRPFSFTIEED